MRLLVCGGRNFAKWRARMSQGEYELFLDEADVVYMEIERVLNWVSNCLFDDNPIRESTFIISGGAPGVDQEAVAWAQENYVNYKVYPANWKLWGLSAGPRRNQQMLDEGKPDHVLAIMGSNGTADMVRRAKKAGIPVTEIK